MILESVTFKYIVELFNFFRINKLDLTYVKMHLLDITKTYSLQFENYNSLNSYYSNNYKTYDRCIMGKYCFVTHFSLESELYGYKLTFDASDICTNYALRIGYPYDNKRLSLIEQYANKQKFLIDKNVTLYCTYSTKFKHIYLYEVYSPCYAEPSWNEGTKNIKTYRDLAEIYNNKVYKN